MFGPLLIIVYLIDLGSWIGSKTFEFTNVSKLANVEKSENYEKNLRDWLPIRLVGNKIFWKKRKKT